MAFIIAEDRERPVSRVEEAFGLLSTGKTLFVPLTDGASSLRQKLYRPVKTTGSNLKSRKARRDGVDGIYLWATLTPPKS